MNVNNQIKYGALLSYLVIFINIVIGLVYTPWMIKSIGKADYGLFTLAMSIISIFIFDFGLSSAVTRFVAKYLAEDNPSMVAKILGLVYKLYIGIDVIILLFLSLVYFLIPSIYGGLTHEEIEKFKIVFAIAATFSVVSFPFIPLNGVISAHEKFIQLKLCDLAHKLITVGLMSLCLFQGYGLYALVIVNAISGVVTIILKLFIIWKNTDVKIEWRFYDSIILKSILFFSAWVTVVSLCQRVIFNLAPSILGIVSDSFNIAILGVAATLEGYVYTFAAAINGLFLPKVSRMVKKDDDNAINSLMIRVGRIQIFVISMIVFGFIAVGNDFIHIWVGSEYSEVYRCAILLMIPSLLYLPMEVGNTTVIAKNEVKSQARVFLIMAFINVTLAFPLSKQIGVTGMCISILVAYLWRSIGMNIVFSRKLSLDIFGFYRESFLKMSPALVFMLGVSLLMHFWHLFPNNFMGVLLQSVLFVSIYLTVFWVFALNRSEKSLLLSPFKK